MDFQEVVWDVTLPPCLAEVYRFIADAKNISSIVTMLNNSLSAAPAM